MKINASTDVIAETASLDGPLSREIESTGAQQCALPYREVDAHPLDILFKRSSVLADRIREGRLQFIDGVDMAYSAAVWSGLVDRFGDDVVQLVLAEAFTGAQT